MIYFYIKSNYIKLLYPSYVKTYLEKDVRDLLNIKDIMQFLKFMKLCAARVGSVFNASELANEIGVDSKTIASWMSVLTASYVVYLLPPYYENISKRLIKGPKLYFAIQAWHATCWISRVLNSFQEIRCAATYSRTS